MVVRGRTYVSPHRAQDVLAEALAMTKLKTELATTQVDQYRYDPELYIEEVLGWTPWNGSDEHPGQMQIIEAYVDSLVKQDERMRYLASDQGDGEYDDSILDRWDGHSAIPYVIHVESGHGMGKTKVASGLVNHHFDCFSPGVCYSLAPTKEQTRDLLWKEIKSDREGKNLQGRILDLALDGGPGHFAKGRVASTSGGTGSERLQGQHSAHILFVLDEAEGIEDFVYDAVDAMTSSGIVVVLMIGNPRTRSSRFHRAKMMPNTRSFRMSCLWHPNVLEGREVIPGGVRRDWVEDMIDKHCVVVPEHHEEWQTFERPYATEAEVFSGNGSVGHREILRPNHEFLFRVMGSPPNNITDKTIVPIGVYEAALLRKSEVVDPTIVQIGVDVARFGVDMGTCYVRHDMDVWRAALFDQQNTFAYHARIKAVILELLAKERRIVRVDLRVDGTGGFGAGVIDMLSRDADLLRRIPHFVVREVHFAGTAYDGLAYYDIVTEMYAEAAESLKGLHLIDPPLTLEGDLCEREFDYLNVSGRSVKKLVEKGRFREKHRRSPDDGDGFVLCVAPAHIFEGKMQTVTEYNPYEIEPYGDERTEEPWGYQVGRW